MKLFVSYAREDTSNTGGFGNAVLDNVPAPKDGNDVRTIQNSIAAAGGFLNVSLITYIVMP